MQQVAVRRVDLGDAKAGRPGRARAASRKPPMTSRMPAASRAVGAGSPSATGIALGANGLPAAVGDREPPATAPGSVGARLAPGMRELHAGNRATAPR